MKRVDVGRRGTAIEALERAAAARHETLGSGAELVLSVTVIEGPETRVLGRFDAEPGLRRETGGPPWILREGNLFLRLALRHPSVLFATPADKILNRNVRPLLAALRKCGPVAMYGGRDFVSADGDIVALIAWGCGLRGEVFLDAAIATEASVLDPHAPPPIVAAHLGKKDRPFTAPELGRRLAEAYAPEATPIVLERGPLPPPVSIGPELASSTIAIGRLALHASPRGPILRGDFFADDRIESLPLHELAGAVVTEGIRDLRAAIAELEAKLDR